MYDLGLGKGAPLDAFHGLLQSHHTLDVRVTLMDLDHNLVAGGDISSRLMDGQVTVDATANITRSLDLDLLDPTGSLHLDSNSPDAGAMFADRMIRIVYGTINPFGTVRYDTPVFTGPITKLDRDGAAIQVTCQGKEIFGLTESWNHKTFKKGVTVTSAIKYIVGTMMGEGFYNIPNLRAKLPRNVSVGGEDTPWQVAVRLARSIGYQLFYDGLGICQMRKIPSASCFTFRQGAGGSVKTDPDVGFSIDRVVNAVEVWGKKPVKKKGKPNRKRPHHRAVAPRLHPLSPWSLGRSGGPRYLPLVIEDESIETDAEAKARSEWELKSGLLESIDVGYDAIPIPHLQELDVVQLNASRFSATHKMLKFAVPLTSKEDMPVGYVRNVKPNVTAIRSKKARTR